MPLTRHEKGQVTCNLNVSAPGSGMGRTAEQFRRLVKLGKYAEALDQALQAIRYYRTHKQNPKGLCEFIKARDIVKAAQAR